jgi:hypothetical protein
MKIIREIYNSELANIPGHNLHTFACNSITSKLHLVKAIKVLTNLGLVESKCLTDDIPFRIQFFADTNKIVKFEDTIRGLVDYELSSLSHIRNNKLIELGIGEKSDFVDYLADKIYVNSFREDFKTYLISVLECLDEDKLKQIVTI